MVEKLMAILAHPDDESLGNGGMLAKYAADRALAAKEAEKRALAAQ